MKAQMVAYRVESDVMAWLRRAAAKRRTTISHIARELLYKKFEERHASPGKV
jgi:hypothetical protein